MFKSTEDPMAKQKFPKTIGFFGDSFCADITDNSWTTLLANKLQAEIINVGKSGSSIWTAILNFIELETVPDYSIFCWTHPRRLYHPSKIATPRNIEKSHFGEVAEKYFVYFWNDKKENLNYKWTLEYFDRNLLHKVEQNTKIVQAFSFKPEDYHSAEHNVKLQSGMILNDSLLKFSGHPIETHMYMSKAFKKLKNHMSVEKNQQLAEHFYNKI